MFIRIKVVVRCHWAASVPMLIPEKVFRKRMSVALLRLYSFDNRWWWSWNHNALCAMRRIMGFVDANGKVDPPSVDESANPQGSFWMKMNYRDKGNNSPRRLDWNHNTYTLLKIPTKKTVGIAAAGSTGFACTHIFRMLCFLAMVRSSGNNLSDEMHQNWTCSSPFNHFSTIRLCTLPPGNRPQSLFGYGALHNTVSIFHPLIVSKLTMMV